MINQNQRLLQQLSLKINELNEKAKHYQHIHLPISCFDEQLFKPSSIKRTGYQHYLDEIKNYHQKLQQLIEQDTQLLNHVAQIDFLTEKLINQIAALSRELVTHQPKHKKTETENLTIFEKHAQYLGYLRKLEWMKSELITNGSSQQKIQQIEERISRCQNAIDAVEHEIELFEHSS